MIDLDEADWWWPLAVTAVFVILALNLRRAQTQGVIELRSFEVKRAERPKLFWFGVFAEGALLIACTILLAQWVLKQL